LDHQNSASDHNSQLLEADPMTTTRRDSPSFGTRGLIFALVLAFMFYLLVSDMVSHHFFSGGAPDSPKTLQSFTPVWQWTRHSGTAPSEHDRPAICGSTRKKFLRSTVRQMKARVDRQPKSMSSHYRLIPRACFSRFHFLLVFQLSALPDVLCAASASVFRL